MSTYDLYVEIDGQRLGPFPAKDNSPEEAERVMREIILPFLNAQE